MAELNPPAWLENSASNHARQARLLATALVSEGVWTLTGLNVSASGGMTVSVALGGCYVKGTQVTMQGAYACYNDFVVNKTLALGGATARIDLIVARVQDSFHGSAADTWDIFVVDGTAVAPAVPATPTNSYVLARVAVGVGAVSVSSGNITDMRSLAVIVRPGGFTAVDLADGIITPAKLASQAQAASVTTTETTTSAAYVDLTTSGPSATVTVSANGLLEVTFGCFGFGSVAATVATMSVALSGANTVAASNAWYAGMSGTTGGTCSRTWLFTGLSAGSTTVTSKYKASGGGTASFANRTLTVKPL